MRGVVGHSAKLLTMVACVVTASNKSSLQEQPSPQFRASIDLTRLELTVLDKRTRKPIKGLTGDDFVIKVGGDLQPVMTLVEFADRHTRGPAALAFTGAAHDLSSNAGPQPRLFVIIMNDAAGRNDPFDRKTGKDVAKAIVDGLDAGDMASVVFVRDNRNPQDFTADHSLLLQAIERFNPVFTVSLSPMSVIRRSQSFLSAMPGYRRAIVFITPLIGSSRINDIGLDGASAFAIAEAEETAARELRAIRTGQIGHVPIYTFSTHGLHAPTREDLAKGHLGRESDQSDEALRSIASRTGGRAIVGHNAPAQMVPAMFEELASYYVVGFRPTYPLDGKLRRLNVEVKHPDAVLMPTDVAIATTKALATMDDKSVAPPQRIVGFAEALAAPVPSGAVPLRLASLPLAIQGAREQAVALTLGLPAVDAGVREQFRITLLLFDGEGRRQLLSEVRDVTVIGASTDGRQGAEVAWRLSQRPGRYNLRIIAERVSTKLAGSVHAALVIPDFASEPLSLSGVAIGLAEAQPVAGREVLDGILPFAPTSVRAFVPGHHVGALMRVHQNSRLQAQPVTVVTEVIDEGGRPVITVSRTIPAGAFAGGAGVDHRYELPVNSLDTGNYVLRFTAKAAESQFQRDVRFSISR